MTFRTNMRVTLLSATVLSGLALATPAMAQEQTAAAAAAAPAAGDIVVTATRRDTTIMNTPINISAIGGKDLEDQHIQDVRDLGAFTPGVTVLNSGPGGAGTIVMRGLSADDTSASGGDNSNSAVGMYLGDVPMYYDFKLIDMQRVETLLGPQGTLYGLGTLAGAIRYIPERPDPTKYSGEIHGEMLGMSHSKDVGYQGYGVVNVPIVKDHIAFRSVTGYYFTPGYIDYPDVLKEPGVSNPQPGDLSNPLGTAEQRAENFNSYNDVNYERTFTTRNQLGFFGDGFSAFITYAHQRTHTGGQSATGGGVVGEGKYEAPWRYLEPSTRTGDLLSLEMEGNIADAVKVTFVSSYTQRKTKYKYDNTDLLIDLDYGYEAFPDFSSYNQSHAKEAEFTQELRFVSTFDSPLSLSAGAFWNRQHYHSNYDEYVPGFPEWANEADNWDSDFITDHSNPEYAHEYSSYVKTRNDEKGLYGEATWHFTPDIQITGGLRYYKYSAYVDGGSYLPLYGGTYATNTGSTGDNGLVYKINASWNITPNVMAYGTWSTGYRIGGVNRVAPCSDAVVADHAAGIDPGGQTLCALPTEQSYGPDKTKNAEIGIRAKLFDSKLMLSLDAYHINWDGIQLASQTYYGAIGITVNGGKAVSKGVDVSFEAHPITGLTIRGTYSYLDAHLTEDVPDLLSTEDGLVSAYAGDRLPGSAKNKGAIGATYEMPVGKGSMTFGWTATYTGDILTRVGERGGGQDLPSYWMHQANITYKLGRYELGVYATNIFDKYAITAVSNDLTRYGVVNDGVISRYYGESVAQPRTVGIRGTVNF